MSHLSGPIDVRVPARADALRILRAVAAGVGASTDMPIDAIEELRIAVDEAATLLLRSTTGSTTLHLRLRPDAGSVLIDIASDGRAETWPPDGFHETWPWLVITGMMDAVDTVSTGGPTVSFRTRPRASAT